MAEQEMKTVSVTLSMWQRLSQIKIDKNFQSLEDVLEFLLKGVKK